MSKERDKFLTELMGMCYPEYIEDNLWDGVERNYFNRCSKCGRDEYAHEIVYPTIDFSTWEGFGKLWQFSQQQCWWADFHSCYNRMGYIGYINEIMVHPRNFVDILYEYHKG